MDSEWQQLVEEVVTGMWDWRVAHPRATFREIEGAVDERLQRVRVRMLEEAALASQATDWTDHPEEGPRCPDCNQTLQGRGYRERGVRVQGDQEVRLRRRYGVCHPSAEGWSGAFPPG